MRTRLNTKVTDQELILSDKQQVYSKIDVKMDRNEILNDLNLLSNISSDSNNHPNVIYK